MMRKLLSPFAFVVLALPLCGQNIISNVGSLQGTVTFVHGDLVTSNLVSEWRFDEGSGDTLTDYVGSNDGQLGSSAGADANDPDWVTAGLDFANSADRVQLPITFDPNGAFSLSLVGYYDNTLATGATIWSQQDGTGTGRSIMLISHELDDLCSFLGGTEVCGSQTVTTGWHQYTLTYDGAGTLTFYVDGDSGATQSATPEAANGAHWIGLNKAGVAVFNEPIAWALYYDDELTAAENNSNCQYLAGAVASRGVSLTCQ